MRASPARLLAAFAAALVATVASADELRAPTALLCAYNGSGVALNNPSFPSTTTVSSSGGSINTYGGPIPGGPDVATIGYLMTFSLSGRSAATFTGSWSGTVVPAPGGAAAFVVAGVVGLARRRRG